MRLEEDDDEDEYIRCKEFCVRSTLIDIIVDYCYDDETDYGYLFMNNDIVNIFRSVL